MDVPVEEEDGLVFVECWDAVTREPLCPKAVKAARAE